MQCRTIIQTSRGVIGFCFSFCVAVPVSVFQQVKNIRKHHHFSQFLRWRRRLALALNEETKRGPRMAILQMMLRHHQGCQQTNKSSSSSASCKSQDPFSSPVCPRAEAAPMFQLWWRKVISSSCSTSSQEAQNRSLCSE